MIDRDIDLELGDKVYKLSPTLSALKKINRRYDSLIAAMEAVKKLDFDAVCMIIGAGTSASQKQMEDLENEVYQAGLVNVVGKVADFLGVLLDPSGGEDEGDSGNP